MEVKLRAKHNYSAARADELSFKKKEELILINKDVSKGWWLARNASGKQGLVPFNYFEEVKQVPTRGAPVERDPFEDLAKDWGLTVDSTEHKEQQQPAVGVKGGMTAKPASTFKGTDEDLERFISEIDSIRISAAPPKEEDRKIQEQPRKKEPIALAPAPAPASAPDDSNDESDFVVWMKRALVAEQQLVEMAKLYEDEHRKLDEALQAADESDKSVLEMIETAALEKAQWERMHEAEKQELRSQLQAAQTQARQAGAQSAHTEEIAQLRTEVARLTRELEEDRALFERQIAEEQQRHRAAVDRANDLFNLYEGARSRFEVMEHELSEKRAAHDETKDQLVDLKRKTARMLELQRQKQESASNATSNGADHHHLEEQLKQQKQVEEELRAEIQSLKSQVLKSSRRSSSRNSAVGGESLQAPPPPPPPPRTPLPDRRSLTSTTKPEKKGPPPTSSLPSSQAPQGPEGFGSMAEMAAKMAQQRAERSKANQTVAQAPAEPKSTTPAPTAVALSSSPPPPSSPPISRTEQLLAAARARIDKPAHVEEPTPAPAKEEETIGQSGVSRTRANEILARAKALAAAAKAKEVSK